MTKMYKHNLKLSNFNLENCHGPSIESMMKTDSRYTHHYDSFDEPYAFLRHISESSRFQQKLIKMQMAQVDRLNEPELYGTLRLLAEYLLKLWILSTESVKNYEIFLDDEA
jgi:hypothetical protein